MNSNSLIEFVWKKKDNIPRISVIRISDMDDAEIISVIASVVNIGSMYLDAPKKYLASSRTKRLIKFA